ncbi:Uma2 family endonuclease [Streptomyces sp. NPDC004042]|uniref:Uma2 family endonuclease n=1 Tax=Streptomyces sp. NPDC004042 TaxID=3154451 RepID=UPI0033BECB1E
MGATAVHWPVPPPAGFSVDDLFTARDLPRRTELIDASLVFSCPPRAFHSTTVDLLVAGLRDTAPEEFRVRREMTVVLDRHNAPAPDIVAVRPRAATGPDLMGYEVKDVLLAVEVVSPDSASRDRTTKPHKYAAAGIEHFWRVEEEPAGRPVVHVYELDPVTRDYVHSGRYRQLLEVAEPWSVRIDLARIDCL